MSYSVIVRPGAQSDMADALRWYEDRSRGLGAEFLRCVEACLALIQRNPLAHPAVHGEVRRALVRRFPYGVFYLLEERTIVVLAVFHAQRDPWQWKKRA